MSGRRRSRVHGAAPPYCVRYPLHGASLPHIFDDRARHHAARSCGACGNRVSPDKARLRLVHRVRRRAACQSGISLRSSEPSYVRVGAGVQRRRYFLRSIDTGGVARLDVALDAATLSVGAFVGLLLLGVCVGIWRSERAVNADWGVAGIEIENGERIVSPRERLIVRCEQLAQEYGLTPREAEVLTLIAQRKTRAEMEQELFLSQNTVKTHVRHVYAKLGVHSKADVYELVE